MIQIMKMLKSSEENLKCICGLCDHDFSSKDCLYNKMVDDANPNKKMYSLILNIMKKEIEHAKPKSKATSSKKTTKRK